MIDVVALALASDPRPDDNNVVAGWVGFAVMIALIVAVVFILRSFTKQLKKVDAAQKAGVFGEEKPEESESSDQTSDPPPTRHQT
jgi:TRAP-type C4-dicarboxylate transport system permease small subunit